MTLRRRSHPIILPSDSCSDLILSTIGLFVSDDITDHTKNVIIIRIIFHHKGCQLIPFLN